MNRWLALAPLLLANAPATQGQVHVVDDDGGPGVDFTDVQPAIDAASDGDVVLVKEGQYGGFFLQNRAMTICGEAGADVQVQSVSVRNLSAGKVARVQGIDSELRVSYVPCYLEDNSGEVWIEDCSFEPAHELVTSASEGSAAIEVIDSPAIILINVRAKGQSPPGGLGMGTFGTFYPASGVGLHVTFSAVSGFGSTFTGGKGVNYVQIGSGHSFVTSGGYGVSVMGSSTVRLAASTAQGGQGGPSIDSFLGGCAYGVGGAGVRTECFLGCPEIVLQGCSVLGGPGGPPYPFSSCPAGPDGIPFKLQEGSILVELASEALRMEGPSPVFENTILDLVLEGPPQALAFLGVSASPAVFFLPSLGAPLVLAAPILGLQLGVIPATGELAVSLPLLELPPGFESMIFYGQSAYLDAQNAVILGEPGMVVLLDAAFQ